MNKRQAKKTYRKRHGNLFDRLLDDKAVKRIKKRQRTKGGEEQ